ncbi:MAG: hypothetical protein AAGI90_02110 [Chlamydiota bacterium]
MTKKQTKKEGFHHLEEKDHHLLSKVIDEALVCIENIQKKDRENQKKIDKSQERLCVAKNDSERLDETFALEGLKIEAFSKLEKDYEKLSSLLDEAYKYTDRIGGIVKEHFLDICQSLSKGIHLELIATNLRKMKTHCN